MSPADLIDKASILRIKMAKLGIDLNPEFQRCIEGLAGLEYRPFLDELEALNKIGWESNEVILNQVKRGEPVYLDEYRHLWKYVKSAHEMNMARNKLKNDINRFFGHDSNEVKSWA